MKCDACGIEETRFSTGRFHIIFNSHCGIKRATLCSDCSELIAYNKYGPKNPENITFFILKYPHLYNQQQGIRREFSK